LSVCSVKHLQIERACSALPFVLSNACSALPFVLSNACARAGTTPRWTSRGACSRMSPCSRSTRRNRSALALIQFIYPSNLHPTALHKCVTLPIRQSGVLIAQWQSAGVCCCNGRYRALARARARARERKGWGVCVTRGARARGSGARARRLVPRLRSKAARGAAPPRPPARPGRQRSSEGRCSRRLIESSDSRSHSQVAHAPVGQRALRRRLTARAGQAESARMSEDALSTGTAVVSAPTVAALPGAARRGPALPHEQAPLEPPCAAAGARVLPGPACPALWPRRSRAGRSCGWL
jgi:hypothetical protein